MYVVTPVYLATTTARADREMDIETYGYAHRELVVTSYPIGTPLAEETKPCSEFGVLNNAYFL